MSAQLTISEEKTKRSIASYLHDKIGYDLITQLNILRDIDSRAESDDLKNSIHELISITQNIISENRSLIFELSPPVLKEAGLTSALEELAEKILEPHKIQWHVISKGNDEFRADDSVCVILYRMARELMINVVKHSGASNVNIIINTKHGMITVAVEDNGKGFDTEKRGFGLFSIRERLLALGGELRIISEPGEGTMAVMSCPGKLKESEFS
jgi:signal transduction histidine kinase